MSFVARLIRLLSIGGMSMGTRTLVSLSLGGKRLGWNGTWLSWLSRAPVLGGSFRSGILSLDSSKLYSGEVCA